MDQFMQDIGIGYMIRTAASAANYGIGSNKNTITHDGNRVKIEVSGMRSFVQMFTIGGGVQKAQTSEGIVDMTPTWMDSGKVVQTTAKKPDGSAFPTMKRYLSSEGLLINEVTSPKGTTV